MRQKVKWVALITLLGWNDFRQLALAATFDSTALKGHSVERGSSPRPGASSTPSKVAKSGFSKDAAAEAALGPAGDPANNVTYETVQSLTQLLGNIPAGAQRNALLLNRAAGLSLFAKKRFLESKQAKIGEYEIKLLQAAMKDSREVLASPLRTPEQIQRAHNLLGFSYLYQDQSKLALREFMEVVRLNPNAVNAGWIGFFIAEDLFDEGQFGEASRYYNTYYSRMSPEYRNLALYKIAWCLINLKQNDKAEELLLRLARSGARQGIGRDSLRDLAFLVSHRNNVSAAIRSTEAQFPQNDDKIEFLMTIRPILQELSQFEVHSEVVERILQLERDPGKRLSLLLANLQVHRKLYASQDYMRAFQKVVQLTSEYRFKPDSAEVKAVDSTLEIEMQALIKAYIDTYAGRTKTPEKLDRALISEALKIQFQFFNFYLPSSKLRPNILDLWLDVCADSKDWACVENTTELILTDSRGLAAKQERAYLDQLMALGELRKTAKRSERMKQFIEKFPASSQWLRVARLYAQGLVEAGQHENATPILDQIYSKDPTEDSYFRVQFARFQSKQHAAILEDQRNTRFPKPGPALRDLWRESSLILAQKAREKEDLDSYRRYLRKFLDLQPDQEKGLAAHEDFIRFMLNKNHLEEATTEFTTLPAGTQDQPRFAEIRKRIWFLLMERGKFGEALQVAGDHGAAADTASKDQDLAFRQTVSRLVLGRVPTVAELGRLRAADREYTLGLLAITRPAVVLDYFKSQPPKAESERDLRLIAYRIQLGRWGIPRNSESMKLFGPDFAYSQEGIAEMLPVEKKIAKVSFPDTKTKPEALAKAIQNLVLQTQKIRKSVSGEISGQKPQAQLKAVEKARDLEARVSRIILESPVPNGLTEEQIAQYREGVKSVAQEFIEQSAEFGRLADRIRETIEKTRAAENARLIPRPDMARWKWPEALTTDPALKFIPEIAEPGSALRSLALLDLLRGERLKGETDYLRIRTGLLLGAKHPDSLRIYLLGELESRGQKEIIEDWRQLAVTGKEGRGNAK